MARFSIHQHPTGGSIFLGALLVLAGLLAIVAPLFAGLAVSIILGWLILVAGVAHLAYAWTERGAGSVIWQILIGIAYLLAAFFLLVHPVQGVVAITLILAVYIALEGVFELVIFSQWRSLPGAGWFLVDGIISLVLAALIFRHWPSSSVWALGTLVGISLLMSGVARFTMPTGRRRLLMHI